LPGGASGNLCKSHATAAPTTATIEAQYADNCSEAHATFDSGLSGVTGNDCSWTATYTYHIADACGNPAADAVVVYTGGDTEAPHLTGTLPGGASGNLCKSHATAAPTTASIEAQYADNCSEAHATFDSGLSGVTGNDCSWTATYT